MVVDNLRVGIVGAGGNSTAYHLPSWWDLVSGRWTVWGRPVTEPVPSQVENLELVSVCDIAKEKASGLARVYGLRAYSDLDDMLAKENLDILDIVTSPETHCACAVKGLKAGANVYVETPMATSVDEAELMVETTRKERKLLAYGENYRFAPHIALLKKMVDAGDLGDLCSLTSIGDTSNFHHRLELMRWLGGEVMEVYARIEGPMKVVPMGRGGAAMIRFEKGGSGFVTGTEYWNMKLPSLRIEYIGTKGRAMAEDIFGELTHYPIDGSGIDKIVLWKPPYYMQQDMGILFRASLAAFAQSVRTGVQPPVTGLDGLRYMQLREAIILSNERNVPIKPY